ncbi:hypothetical protein [Treponema sp. R6D11]
MEEINIVHYCHSLCMPLQSITELPETEAYKLADKLATNNATAFCRFKDFRNYYPRRIETEKWLYNWFLKLGGKPKTEHPLYFVLEKSDYLNEWFDKGKIIKIPLSKIEAEHISFTLGDSCANFDKNNRQDPFLKDKLYKMIEENKGNVNELLEMINQKYNYHYIECQLWKKD